MIKSRAVGVLLMALSVTAGAANPPAKAPADPEGKQKLVCFAEASTGSHLKKRVCMTEAERERRQSADREALEKAKRSAGPRPGARPGQN